MPSGMSALWLWCHSAGFDVSVKYVVARVDGSVIESHALRACVDTIPWKARGVGALYVNGTFASGLVSDIGKVKLWEVKRALGMIVKEPATRGAKEKTVPNKATKKDTLR